MTADLRSAILRAADAVDAARPELGRLDGAAGDGDHGMTMSIAARNVRKRLDAIPPDGSPADLLRGVASAIGGVGGAIGPLHAAALTAMAAELATPIATGPGGVAQLRRLAETAEAAITRLGGASPGDKTVIDALHPVVEGLRASEASGSPIDVAIEAAAAAAEGGAAATADMVARIGRASRLGERSRGLPDAGATSLAIVIRSLADSAASGHSVNRSS